MTFEAAVTLLRTRPNGVRLLQEAYLDANPREAAVRFAASGEFAEALRLLSPAARGIIVDLGAGNGIATYAFAQAGAAQVIAIEPDPSPLVGRRAIENITVGLPVETMDALAERLPLPNLSVDIVYVRQALHHLHDLPGACREFYRVLRPGGVVLACREPVVDSPAQLRRLLASHPIHRLTGSEGAYPLPEYLVAFKMAGFELKHIWGHWDSVINAHPTVGTAAELAVYPAAWLSRRLGPIGRLLGRFALFRGLAYRWLSRSVPGRLYTFLAQKT
jgi:SAM-dependent methyltransferase